MKAWINLLIRTDAYDDPERLEDLIVHLAEEESLKVLWSKSSEAKE